MGTATSLLPCVPIGLVPFYSHHARCVCICVYVVCVCECVHCLVDTRQATQPEHAAVRVWSTESWREVCLFSRRLTISPDRCAYEMCYLRHPMPMLLTMRAHCTKPRLDLLQIYQLKGHKLTVTDMQFSHNDQWLVTASRDRHVGIYRLQSGRVGPRIVFG
jgi:WD40 repeat protein